MRIIGGRHRGRALRVPKSEGVRPSSDRLREAVFNILAHGIDWPGWEEATVLDLFAGTGAYGLEALSRGAAWATFVDLDAAALTTIRRNAAAMDEARCIALLRLDATRLPPPPGVAEAPCRIAFLDAPYEKGLSAPALASLIGHGWLAPGSVAVVEVAVREVFPPPPGATILDERMYGAGRVIFLKVS